jgi:hypothetical protein
MSDPKSPVTQVDALFLRMLLDVVSAGQGLGKAITVLGFNMSLSDEERKLINEAMEQFSEKQQAVLDAAKEIIALANPTKS